MEKTAVTSSDNKISSSESQSERGEVKLSFDTTSLKRGSERTPLNISEGDVMHGYVVKRKKEIPERNLTTYYLIHEKSGAEHIHIECDDSDNVFYIALKTIPTDNKGIPHILEHLTLCGSEKYPVRDPFFNMLKRSLNTYMNAWTGSDFTGYPFSTQNVKDYYNLMSIYLDAVFKSKLDYLDFLQEGHRLEFNEESQKLEHKGVVYNEMKGAMSDPNDLYGRERDRHVYTKTTYHYNSGGDPSAIRTITHQDLLDFKDKFYHPSNSYTVTYGDLPPQHHFEFLDTYFSQYEKAVLDTDIPDDEKFSEPKKVVFHGPMSSMADPEKQVKVSVTWLVNKLESTYEKFATSILSYLLTSGPNSPMYQALVASNIGSSYTSYTGYYSSPKEGTFSFGLNDIAEKDIELVENLIYETLEKVSKEGFKQERIDSVLHQWEYDLKNVKTGFGLNLLMGITAHWIHFGDPIDSFVTNEHIDRLLEDIKSGPFFENMVKKILLENKHRVTFIMKPSKEYSEKEGKDEADSLTSIEEGEDFSVLKEKIVDEAKRLKERQEMVDDVECLPKIKLEEIDRHLEKVTTTATKVDDIDVFWNDQPTNGIVYFRSMLDLSHLPADLLPYLPLFTNSLTKMETESKTYQELSQAIELSAGSFSASARLQDSPTDLHDFQFGIQLTSSCLERNIETMFDLWKELFSEAKFDNLERLKTLIGNKASSMHDSMVSSGHRYARLLSSQSLLPHYRVREKWEGIHQYQLMKKLNEKEDLTEVSDTLKRIAKLVLTNNMKIAINGEKKNFSAVENNLKEFVATLPKFEGQSLLDTYDLNSPFNKAYVGLESQVNFVAQSYLSVPYTHEDYSKLDVLVQILSLNYLHREIREKGGAYGGGLVNTSGTLSFYSYRDPKVNETMDIFKKSIDWIIDGEFEDYLIEEAKLQLFASLDSPVSPGGKGLQEFLSGLTWEMRQERRNRIFEVTREDIIDVCRRYLKEGEKTAYAVLGSNKNETFKNDPEWKYIED